MKPIEPGAVLENLNWRYATKKFDPSRKIPADLWASLERAMTLAPSSFGLQPWVFVVVTDPALRTQLRAVGMDLPQITDASHLVVFCRRTSVTNEYIDRYIERIAQVRGVSKESLAGFRKSMVDSMARPASLHGGSVDAWAGRQVYIALGFFVFAAAMLGIDACPMEGFDAAGFDRVLDLRKDGLAANVIATAGYRLPDDPAAGRKKVRFAEEDVIRRR